MPKVVKGIKKGLSSLFRKKEKKKEKKGPKEKTLVRKKEVLKEEVFKEPALSLETKVEEAKYFTRPQEKSPVRLPRELPLGYGEDKIVLQTRDPWWIHTYWEITPKTQDSLKEMLGADFFRSKKILRCYDVSHIIFDGKNAHRFFDIEINDYTNNWYIDTGSPGTSWIVDLGILLPDNRFITIVRSNVAHTPLEGPSWITDEEWMVPEEVFARLYGVGLGISSPSGEMWQQRLKKEWASMAVASPGMSSLMSPVKRVEKERGFWLVVNTELIVYGQTLPDAKVTVQGQPIQLRSDGTFSLRFFLPDGKQIIPVEARASDGLDTQTITPIVTKETR